MARRSKKSIAKIVTPSTSLSSVESVAKVHKSSSPSPSLRNNDGVNFDVAVLEKSPWQLKVLQHRSFANWYYEIEVDYLGKKLKWPRVDTSGVVVLVGCCRLIVIRWRHNKIDKETSIIIFVLWEFTQIYCH